MTDTFAVVLTDELRPMFQVAKNHFGTMQVIGVEVGTNAGINACEVIKGWKEVSKLWCIDYYPTYSDFRFKEDQEIAINSALLNFVGEPKIHLMIDKSAEAAKKFEDESLDFVYIDANHSYEFVKEDIAAWLPKVKKGGIIGGHDYDWSDPEHNEEFAVKKAVDEMFGDRVHYHLSLFTKDSKTRMAVEDLKDPNKLLYTGVNSDWWVFV